MTRELCLCSETYWHYFFSFLQFAKLDPSSEILMDVTYKIDPQKRSQPDKLHTSSAFVQLAYDHGNGTCFNHVINHSTVTLEFYTAGQLGSRKYYTNRQTDRSSHACGSTPPVSSESNRSCHHANIVFKIWRYFRCIRHAQTHAITDLHHCSLSSRFLVLMHGDFKNKLAINSDTGQCFY